MFKRLVREEAGMTMGLVVIMVVLIGVMGAGLLTFVRGDLESVIEVNRGQKAAEVADAGVQAAKRQLIANSFPDQYNDTATFLPASDPENSSWAFNVGSATCGDLPSGAGRCITTPDGQVRVTIKYLPPPTTLAATGTASRGDPNYAPVSLPAVGVDYPDGRDYFRVESDGTFNGARRKVQAIFVTQDIGIPKSYFASKNINLSGGMTIKNFSLFAKGNVEGVGLDTLTGVDTAYGNWQVSPYNDKARLGNSTLSNAVPGVGAEGTITYTPSTVNTDQRTAPSLLTDRYKRLDFDNGTGTAAPSPNYKFCAPNTSCWPTGTSQPANVISYPFRVGNNLDFDLLRAIAEQQIRPGTGPASSRDNYVEQPVSAGTVNVNETTFFQATPALSSVFVVRFTGATSATPGRVVVNPDGLSTPCPIRGIILVLNGNVETSSSGARCFDGIISIQDPADLGSLIYKNNGNFSLNGFVNVDGSMTMAGSVSPLVGNDVLNMPGYHDVKLWSWRECQNVGCG